MKTFTQYLESSDAAISNISASLEKINYLIRTTAERLTELEGKQPLHSNLRLKQISPIWKSMSDALNSVMEAEKHFNDIKNGWKDYNDPNFSRPDPEAFQGY